MRRTLGALTEAVMVDPCFAGLRSFTGPTVRYPGPEGWGHGSAAAPVGRGAAAPLCGNDQTSQPTKWTTPASRLVRKFIR
nr:hypothetical protein C5F59_34825 [Streptomyces sp. QL37]